mmetsp:Transcript_14717/g.35906  ORF Transcript_14717/g.35906 Transcript_14717/m.35906 type:complete len:90 (-) Transcript_14717:184-453(-)
MDTNRWKIEKHRKLRNPGKFILVASRKVGFLLNRISFSKCRRTNGQGRSLAGCKFAMTTKEKKKRKKTQNTIGSMYVTITLLKLNNDFS